MIFNVHAGHNPDGKTACGAVGLIKESTEARKVKNKVIEYLKNMGHVVYDCTCENGKSQSDVLNQIITKCNAHKVDLDISIHFNAGASTKKNGATTGTEVLIYNSASKAKPVAEAVAASVSKKCGFKNRGVKTNARLAFLKRTASPALLVECCFVDDPDDVERYDAGKMAKAITEGILGKVCADPVADTVYQVRVNTLLNVRAGAGTNYPVKQTVDKGDVFTIVQTDGSWGKLKSGAGWISLNYTTRL